MTSALRISLANISSLIPPPPPPEWPATLPQCPILHGFAETPQSNVGSFDPPVGAPRRVRRSTAKSWLNDLTYRMTNAELVTFKTFFETTLADGSLPFLWTHPLTGVEYYWAFNPGDEPTITRTAPNASTVSFRLIRLPP